MKAVSAFLLLTYVDFRIDSVAKTSVVPLKVFSVSLGLGEAAHQDSESHYPKAPAAQRHTAAIEPKIFGGGAITATCESTEPRPRPSALKAWGGTTTRPPGPGTSALEIVITFLYRRMTSSLTEGLGAEKHFQ